jgi:hypothetical protein
MPPGEWPGAAAPAPAPAPRSAARRRQRTFVDGFLPEKTPKTRDFTLAKPGKICQKIVAFIVVNANGTTHAGVEGVDSAFVDPGRPGRRHSEARERLASSASLPLATALVSSLTPSRT